MKKGGVSDNCEILMPLIVSLVYNLFFNPMFISKINDVSCWKCASHFLTFLTMNLTVSPYVRYCYCSFSFLPSLSSEKNELYKRERDSFLFDPIPPNCHERVGNQRTCNITNNRSFRSKS